MDSKVTMPFAVPEPEKEIKIEGVDLKTSEIVSQDGARHAVKIESTPNTVVADPNRPDFLPTKFKDTAELKISAIALLSKSEPALAEKLRGMDHEKDAIAIAAIYRAYESEQGKAKPPADETPEQKAEREAKEAAAAAPVPLAEADKARALEVYGGVVGKVLNDANVKGEDLAKTYAEKGTLDQSQYDALEKAGFSKQIVDTFLTGSVGMGNKVADQQIKAIKDSVGGQEAFQKIATWAATGLDADEQAEYNAAVSSGNQRLVNKAVADLKARYDKANGSAPTLVGDGATTPAPERRGNDNVQAFRSWQEVTAAMNDPRYKNGDPAYHADIDARLAKSTL